MKKKSPQANYKAKFSRLEKQLALKSRELEIETALEKVRKSALGMRQPADMIKVCRIISSQLKTFGVKNIRNIQTVILNERNSTYLNYQYFLPYSKSIIEETEYTKHPKAHELAKTVKKSANAFFNQSFRGKSLDTFRKYRKDDKQFPDPLLDKSSSVHFYFYSIGPGALGISTYNTPLIKDDLNLLRRFRNVFELAYRRFVDIEQAIAQARQAKIEAALEKVRAVAMSMNKPEDLLKICEVLYKEFYKLGFDEMRNAMINIHNDEKKTFLNYDYSDEIGNSITTLFYNIHPVIEKQIKQIRSANDAFSETVFDGKDLESWKEFRRSRGEKDDPRISNISALYYYFYSIGTGSIGISTFNAINEEKLALLKRFRNVFSLAYQRYSDIALAEAQAREAKIELALERVRARTMAMHKSEELSETAYVLFQQFKEIDKEPKMLTIGIMNENEGLIEFWVTDWSGGGSKVDRKFNASINEPILLNKIYTAWMERQKSIVIELSNEELLGWVKYRISLSGVPDKTEYSNRRGFVAAAFFSRGLLSISTYEPFSPETMLLLERFAGVFNLTYTRFLDLEKAEAQVRGAQIEAALERVRSRTMGMQKSEELKDVIRVVYEQFVHLKINVDHAGFVVDYTPKGDWHFWIADEQDIPSKISHPYFDSVWAHQFNEAKEKGADFFATNLNFEEKNKFYNELLSYVPGLPETSKDFYLNCPGLAASTVLLENVSLYIENFSGIPYSDEENKTLMRFGNVFQQTYTRFLDLQKAEAQARESQIEAALERVRAKAMAMHSSNDLSETMGVLFTELPKLGISSLRCGVVLLSKNSQRGVFYAAASTSESDSFTMIGSGDMTAHPVFENQYNCWLKNENYFTTLSGEGLQSYYKSLFARLAEPYTPREHKEQTEYGYYFPFSEGMFYAWDEKPYLENEINILNRFKAIIDLTFRRYLDLQNAEAQAREAQIELALERVRARTMAMQRSEELAEAAYVLFQQFKELGQEPEQFTIGIINEVDRVIEFWHTWLGSPMEAKVIMSIDEPHVAKKIYTAWKEQNKSAIIDLSGKDLKEYNAYRKKRLQEAKVDLGTVLDEEQRRIIYLAFFSKGTISISTHEPRPAETIQLLERFAGVFDLTYTRFLDLKNAEAQAHEAKIEMCLERVRARTMAMQRSEELSDTSFVLFKQLEELGEVAEQISIGIFNEQEGVFELYSTIYGSQWKETGRFPLTKHPVHKKTYESWKEQKKSLIIDLSGEELEDFNRFKWKTAPSINPRMSFLRTDG